MKAAAQTAGQLTDDRWSPTAASRQKQSFAD
jgi:hypothetical protein